LAINRQFANPQSAIDSAVRQSNNLAILMVRILSLPGLPEIQPGDDLVALIVAAAARSQLTIESGDVVVVTQKIVSKAENRLVRLDTVTPSSKAIAWARAWKKDARMIELVLREATRIVRMERGVVIAETRHGLVCANAGVDTSNVRPGWAALLPSDPDASARRLSAGLRAALGAPLGVVISDTFGRPWREGQTNVAIGVAGLRPILDYRGQADSHGQRLVTSAIAVADELAAAAELVMGKTRGVPVAVVGGTRLGTGRDDEGSAAALLRRREEDMFR
jgi:coenzyme F420-0:L-glutamate ligase/coenzyme F420-1:gamma-L-glutamate ligase